MTQVTISLPESAKAFIDEQIANGQYGSADLMMADLIAQAQERQVNSLLKATVNSSAHPSHDNILTKTQQRTLASRNPIHPTTRIRPSLQWADTLGTSDLTHHQRYSLGRANGPIDRSH